MKVKWIRETEFLRFENGKIYDVISVEKDWYRLIDGSGEDYLYPPECFEIVDSEGIEALKKKGDERIKRNKGRRKSKDYYKIKQ